MTPAAGGEEAAGSIVDARDPPKVGGTPQRFSKLVSTRTQLITDSCDGEFLTCLYSLATHWRLHPPIHRPPHPRFSRPPTHPMVSKRCPRGDGFGSSRGLELFLGRHRYDTIFKKRGPGSPLHTPDLSRHRESLSGMI